MAGEGREPPQRTGSVAMELAAAERDRTRLLVEEMTDLACEAFAPEDVEQVRRLRRPERRTGRTTAGR